MRNNQLSKIYETKVPKQVFLKKNPKHYDKSVPSKVSKTFFFVEKLWQYFLQVACTFIQ